jgi:hypothetical protein
LSGSHGRRIFYRVVILEGHKDTDRCRKDVIVTGLTAP